MASPVTYESLQEDSDFLSNAYWYLKDVGETVSQDPKDILDTFMEKRRAFDANIASTYSQGSTIADASADTQRFYKKALDKLDKMPSFWSKGGAPTGKALWDYGVYGITDPTNLLSVVAGAFTLGTGTAAAFSAKEAAKQGFRQVMLAKLKASVSKPVLKALALEGTIAGTGGATQSILSQDVDMEIGRKDPNKGYDYSQIALQGLLEGTLSPVAGALINIGSTGLIKGIPSLIKEIPHSEKVTPGPDWSSQWGVNWIKRNFLPTSAQDAQVDRIVNIKKGEFRPEVERMEIVTNEIGTRVSQIAARLKSEGSSNPERDINTIVNNAIEGNPNALKQLKEYDPKITDLLNEYRKTVEFLQARQLETPYSSNYLDELYKRQPTYNRDVYEKFSKKREPFDKWIVKQENKNVRAEYKKYITDIVGDAELKVTDKNAESLLKAGFIDNNRKILPRFLNKNGTTNHTEIDNHLDLMLREAYKPILDKKLKYGTIRRREEIAPIIRHIYGQNFNAAFRAMVTINALNDNIVDLRMAGTLQDNLLNRTRKIREELIAKNKREGLTDVEAQIRADQEIGGQKLGVIARSKEEAEALNKRPDGTTVEMVPLITHPNMYARQNREPIYNEFGDRVDRFEYDPLNPDSPISIPGRLRDPTLGGDVEIANPQYKIKIGDQRIIGKDLKEYKDINPEQLYIPKDMALKIKEMLNQDRLVLPQSGNAGPTTKLMGEAINIFSMAQGYFKKGLTVYSPVAHVRNALGMGGYVANTGNLTGGLMAGLWWKKATKEQRKEFLDQVNRLGLKGSQVEIGQILNRLGKRNNFLESDAKLNKRLLTGNPLALLDNTKLDKSLMNVYTKTDDIGKLGTFFSERMSEQRIWNKTSEADKIKIREAYSDAYDMPNREAILRGEFDKKIIDETAADKTLNVVPVYDRVPRIIEKMRGIPVMGNFGAFPAENLRNKYYLFKIAGEEIKKGFETNNMELVRAGSRRLLSQGAYASAPTVMAYAWNQINGTSDAADTIREGLNDWQKDHAIAVRKTKDGYKYVDLSYSNTDAAVLDIVLPFMTSAARGENISESLDELFPRAVWNYLSSFLEPSLATKQIENFVAYVKSENDEERSSVLADIGETIAPGIVKQAVEMGADFGIFDNKAFSKLERAFRPLYYEERKRFEDSADLSEWLARHNINTKYGPFLAAFGLVSGEKEFNPKKTFGFTSRHLQRNVLEDVASTKKEMLAKISDPELDYDLEDMLYEYGTLFEEQFVAQQGIAKLIGKFSNIMPNQEILRMVHDKKLKGSLSKKQISSIVRGRFSPETLSKDFIKSIIKAYSDAERRGKKLAYPKGEVISKLRAYHNAWKGLDLNINLENLEEE